MIAPARVAAYDILRAVSTGQSDLATATAAARASLADDRDRALATEIAAGVQRWRASLDHVISVFAKRSLDRLDPEVVDILRLGAYQLLHLTRVPASAVVDDAVNLTRRAGKKSAAGFVNAILRTVSRKRRTLPLPTRPSDRHDRSAVVEYFSVALSHPRWLAERWYDRVGFDAAERWLLLNNEPAPLTLRANRPHVTTEAFNRRLHADEELLARPSALVPGAFVVEAGSAVGIVEEGFAMIQDEASQIVGLLAADAAAARHLVLDACASPGGKTVMMAAAMADASRIVASDVRDRRIALLRRTVAASAATNVRLVQADLLKALPFSRAFDLVVVDAPCSGLGTLRRDPDIRWRRDEADLALFAAAELTMLQHAADAVSPGGLLIYATCSSEPEENEGVADALCATTPHVSPAHAREVSTTIPDAVIDARGHVRTQPHLHGLEAFFAAAFRVQ